MVYIIADHGGRFLAQKLSLALRDRGYEICDLTPQRFNPRDDYPLLALQAARRVINKPGARGIVICRSGVGMAVAANKISKIRAVAALTSWQVRRAREEEDANILSLAAEKTSMSQALSLALAFLTTKFRGLPRYRRRLAQITKIEHHD